MSGAADHYVHIDEVKYVDDQAPLVPIRRARIDVAADINNLGVSYYSTGADGSRAPVETVLLNGTWYIRTKSDGSKADNLLKLKRYN
jgi:hypothetical protein